MLEGHICVFFSTSDLVFLCFKVEVGFSEHLISSFRKSEFVF